MRQSYGIKRTGPTDSGAEGYGTEGTGTRKRAETVSSQEIGGLAPVAFFSACVTAFTLLLAATLILGCDPIVISRAPIKPPGPLNLTLTGFGFSSDTLTAGGFHPVSGLLETDGALTQIDYGLFKGDSATTRETGVLLHFLALQKGRSKWDLRTEADLRIFTDSSAQPGTYTLRITAGVGDSLRRFSLDFSVFPEFEPKTAATITGIWRSELFLPTSPATVIHVMMQIDAGGTLVLSQLLATGRSSPYDFENISRESMDWTVADGAMRTKKTGCAYRDPVTFEPTGESDCRAPLEDSVDIVVSRGIWTLRDSGSTLIFRKD